MRLELKNITKIRNIEKIQTHYNLKDGKIEQVPIHAICKTDTKNITNTIKFKE